MGTKLLKKSSFSLTAILLVSVVIAPSVLAAITIDEYSGLSTNSQPHGIAQGPDGNMWFTEFNADAIGVMDADGTLIQEYTSLTAGAFPHHITVGPDDRMWFTEYGHETGVGSTGAAGIGAVDTSGNITEYPLPNALADDPRPHDIITGPDGNLWFTQINTHEIGRIQTDGTLLADFDFATLPGTVDPYGIAVGPDNNLWITDWGSNDQIIQMDTSGNILNTYPITGGYTQPYDIALGSDNNLWFTLQGGSQDGIAKINPTTGDIDYYPLAANSGNSNPHGIVAGPDNNLWFTEQSSNQVGMITTNGAITEYPTPTTPSGPFGIATGPDNTIWFTEAATTASQIGKITGLDIPTPAPDPGGGSDNNDGTPGAPDTGFGVNTDNPLSTFLLFSLTASVLFGLALGARKLSKL